MKIKTLIACFILACAATSCIQDEALNSEAAIDACTGDDVQLANINADSKLINVYVNKGADLSKQKLEFVIPEGATIKINDQVAGDTEATYDFSEEPHSRKFTVTSEDGQWKPVYTVNVANSKTDYPTVQIANGFRGKGVKLETRDTGSFGASVKMYIAAGNLFIGTFEVGNALANPRKATNFGFQFDKRPKTLKGHYKFKAGDVYSAEGKPQEGVRDKCDIYAVMYEAENNSVMLNGDDVFTSNKLVSLARIKPEDVVESDQWTDFEIPFEPVKGQVIDDTKLKNGEYKLGIVFSSSVDGAYFKGAVGSTLYVDEVELICED